MPAPAALAEQDKQKQNILCLENTPSYFYTQTRCFHFDESSPKDFFFVCFNVKQTQLKTLKAAAKRNCHSLDSWDRVTASCRAWKQTIKNIPAARLHHFSFSLSFTVSLHWRVHEHQFLLLSGPANSYSLGSLLKKKLSQIFPYNKFRLYNPSVNHWKHRIDFLWQWKS